MTVVARPRTTMWTAAVLSSVLLLGSAWLWVALGADIRARVTFLQAATLAFFVLFMIGFMLAVGLSYVRADQSGLTFRNGLVTHRLRWDEVARIRYREGDPWAFVYLVDGHPAGRERYQLLGIQQTDGERAVELARRVAATRPAGA